MSAFDKLQNVLVPFSEKINSNKALRGISGGFSSLLPIIMVGAIFTLLSSLNIAPYQTFITSIGLKQIFAIPSSFTTDLLALYAVFLISQAEAKVLGMDETDATASGVITLMFFLILTPLGVTGTDSETGVSVTTAAAVSTAYFGSKGLFTAMILGIIVPRLHNIFIKNHISIKLPDTVPPMISKAFEAMIPALALALVAAIVKFGFTFTSAGNMTDWIYALLKAPLSALTKSPFTYWILLVFCNLLWFFGIHGGMVANSFRAALYTEASLANLAAYGAGETIPNILDNSAWFAIGNIGGSACAIGLCLSIAFFAKSQRYKALGKVCLPAGLCSISEPMVFGVPMVLNPLMLIPMLLAPTATFFLGYGAMAIGLVPYTIGSTIPNGTPVLLSGFLAWGNIQGVILQAVLIAVSTLIYLPFFKMMDKQALAEEAAAEKEENA